MKKIKTRKEKKGVFKWYRNWGGKSETTKGSPLSSVGGFRLRVDNRLQEKN